MNFLLLLKTLAGLMLGAVVLLALFFVVFMIWLYRSYPKKITKKGFEKLKSSLRTFLEYYFLIGGLAVTVYYCPFVLFFIGIIELIKWRQKKKAKKGKSTTRQRMEQLRTEYGEHPLEKKDRLRLRKIKNDHHRRQFLNRLASRKR